MTLQHDFSTEFKEDRLVLQTSISMLEKNMNDFKEERKSDWNLFKKKYMEDYKKIKKSLKSLKKHNKK